MANNFTKQENVAFEEVAQGFTDGFVVSRNVKINRLDQVMAERGNNTIWRPQPYIATSYSGLDQTQNFDSYTQLSVPATINTFRVVPMAFTALELRDQLQSGELANSAKQRLAMDVEQATQRVITTHGSQVVKRTGSATGFDDVAQIRALLDMQGVPKEGRCLAVCSDDYIGMAGNLQVSTRSFGNEKSEKAYEEARVGKVAGFQTLEISTAPYKAAAAGGAGITMSTLAGANNFYVPKATALGPDNQQSNVDNRFQTITVSTTVNVAPGDSFTIAGVTACHLISKEPTVKPKTFRVVQVVDGTKLLITSPIVSGQGGSDAELQNQNCVVSPSASAAITFLNTANCFLNPFWVKDSIEILPGRLVVDDNSLSVLRATLDNGFEVMMTKQSSIDTLKTKIRFDIFYGVVNLQPQMSGVIMFSQP